MYRDHEFDPVTPEEQARREQEEEFARRVRREVRRMERGEAEEDIRADEEREAEERAEAEERERRERRRRSSTFWQLFSGTILVRDVQKLRERSIRLQEQRYQRTTHSAIVEQLRARGIELYDPQAPGEIIEN